ncbi:uncharacterized protein LOC117345110 [Pecten maximus]|uniref:uncharacterized protein LOC117345110 n=1 Tax=Pecten maximus TaxID=6579 RepID=UPI001458AB91|nr:uncharacterized protein LOC117345110 [Pecten maximus]
MAEDRVIEEYSIPLKDSPRLQDCPQFVYSVDDGTLPSNIRSVFLTKVQLTREYQRSRVCLSTCCSHSKDEDEKTMKKKKMWFIFVLVVVVMSLVTAFAAWEFHRKSSKTPQLHQWHMKEDPSDAPEHGGRLHKTTILSVYDKTFLHRTPCRKICWDFSAFKFRSKCMDGFCRCEGQGYNPHTCLPDIDGCQIQTDDVTYADASINGKRISTFSCKQKSSEGNAIHVFSVFGMGDSTGTVLDLKGANNNDDITVVLSSYQSVNWILRVDKDVRIRNIIMMQTSSFGESDLLFERSIKTERPAVSSYRQQSGYGDDREGGHTVQLLQTITREVGQITTFTGSKYADYFSLDLGLISTDTL